MLENVLISRGFAYGYENCSIFFCLVSPSSVVPKANVPIVHISYSCSFYLEDESPQPKNLHLLFGRNNKYISPGLLDSRGLDEVSLAHKANMIRLLVVDQYSCLMETQLQILINLLEYVSFLYIITTIILYTLTNTKKL